MEFRKIDTTKAPPKPENRKWRTFKDFVKHACRSYGGDYKETEKLIIEKLRSKRLSSIAIVCYINWADNGYFTQEEIAKQFNFTQQAVEDHIRRLRQVWPHLPSHPNAKGQRKAHQRSNDFGRMTRLKRKVLYGARTRVVW